MYWFLKGKPYIENTIFYIQNYMMEYVEQITNDLIDKAMDIDQMRFYEEAENKVKELKRVLRYFELDLNCIFFRW